MRLYPDFSVGIIIKSRVRLARNLRFLPFKVDDERDAREVVKEINRAIVKCGTFNLYNMGSLSPLDRAAMKEKHLISACLAENTRTGACLIDEKAGVSVMIHEEDLIREQCFMKGLRLKECYRRLSEIDDEIWKNLDVAYDERLGYLTACPTNVGTGLRASVMLFLPALTKSGQIPDLVREMEERAYTVRGVYGEGSKADGFVYQISNELTLGKSEYEILSGVEEIVEKICAAERRELSILFENNKLKIQDAYRKSYAILTNALLLSYGEFLEHISNIKIGAIAGIADMEDISAIDDLIVSMRPAVLCKDYGRELIATERDLFRAEITAKKLIKLTR